MHYTTKYKSEVGLITIASDGENIVGLWIEGQKYYGEFVPIEHTEQKNLEVLDDAKVWLDKYFRGEAPKISDLPLAPIGGEFRQEVWDILCKIPYGETVTYGDIAKEMALKMNKKSMSAQAVGGAVGHNPISIIIPCHRVVGTGGSLTGYAGGIDKKIKLLEIEGVDTSKFSIPKKDTAL